MVVPVGGEARGRRVPPLDAELAVALGGANRAPGEPMTAENLAAWQQRDVTTRPRPTLGTLRADGLFDVRELQAPTEDGHQVVLVEGRPARTAATALPVVYYVHGGGMVMGNAWSVLPRLLREWALPLGLAVVSVEYRLAPAAQYQEPVEDCHAGLLWLVEHAAALGLDADRLVLGGKSAGAGLTAGLALLNRDRGGPAPLGQMLLSPMLDDRNDSFSAQQLAGHDTWDRTSNATAWRALLGERHGRADVSPYAAPARATDLGGLPPTYIEVGSAETFRDEAVAYAHALWRAGGDAELHVWPGACHGFDSIAPQAAVSRTAQDARTHWLRRLLER
ncbi:acetyl esterase/lipase [Streptacidiphilus sp. MAP12-33]|uniref:alpha/beta hydrolase n=1 Tax=Streptacidiphilus sp. MAP12-33 TaxID=3156266 RepID=UPI0035142896